MADLIIPGYRVARLTPLKSAQPVFPWLWKKNVVSVIYLSTHLILPDISNPNGLNLCESVVFHHVVKWATSNLQSSRLSPWSMEDQNHTHSSNGKNRYVHCRIVLVKSIFLEQSRLWRNWRQGSLLIDELESKSHFLAGSILKLWKLPPYRNCRILSSIHLVTDS